MKLITLTLQPSRTLLALLVGAGLFFSLMLFLVPLPLMLRFILLSIILLATVYFSLRDALLILPWSCALLKTNAKNQLQLARKNGNLLEVTVQENTVVMPYLTVLNCQFKEATFLQRLFPQHIVILPDAVDAETYRQLRVWLRWAKLKVAGSLDATGGAS